ncbi:hypothetical protein EC968_003466 [Mortierella alpina]|nr:hypothetical protein EC968_003466 [Mortierella alpina]
MDDFYQFMSPLEGANNNASDRPSTRPQPEDAAATAVESSGSETTPTPSAASRASWSTWGASFNKLIERGKKDMNEFVDVTRKDLTELVHTVQQERTTALESLTKKVEDLKTTLPPLPASVNTASADILGRVSHVVEGIKQEITEAATGVSSQVTTAPTTESSTSEQGDPEIKDENDGEKKDTEGTAKLAGEEGNITAGTPADAPHVTPDSTAARSTRAEKTASISLASTASLFTAGAATLTQTLSSSTKDISSSANQLFKKTLPAVAEKHLGEADQFLKSTTESLKSNGQLAEQYVNKFGAGMANFLNSAVVISPPEEKEIVARKKMHFDRKAAMLEKLRMDPATYTVDPMTTISDNDVVGLERYKYFLQTFNMAEYQQRISRLLNEFPELKALMNKLVPVDVADEELFWLRYHFRLFEIEEEEKRRQKLVQEAGADLAEEDFTWDDNDEDEDEAGEGSGGQGSITPKADKKTNDSVTPKASQILSKEDSFQVKREPLTAEALASSLSALPIPDGSTATVSDQANAKAESDDEWGSESLRSASSPSAKSFSAKSSAGSQSKSPTTNLSSTRTSEDAYEVVDGVATPVRVPLANVLSLSSEAGSPAVERPVPQQQGAKGSYEFSIDEDGQVQSVPSDVTEHDTYFTHHIATFNSKDLRPWTKGDTEALRTPEGQEVVDYLTASNFQAPSPENDHSTTVLRADHFLILTKRLRVYRALWHSLKGYYDQLVKEDRQDQLFISPPAEIAPAVALLQRLEQVSFPWILNHYNSSYDLYRSYSRSKEGGRGIIMCVGNHHTQYARPALKALREVVKSKLPVEIYYNGQFDLSAENRAWFEQFENVRTIDITTVLDNNLLQLSGWAVKPFALLVSRFSEAILMDSDAYFLDDPAVMFEDDGYKEVGTVYFYDRTLFPGYGGDEKAWIESFLPSMSNHPSKTRWFNRKGAHEMESGVVVFDKRRHLLGLLAICKMNDRHEREQVTYIKSWGDKETFWIGLEMIQERYSFVRYRGGVIGNVGDAIPYKEVLPQDEIERYNQGDAPLTATNPIDPKTKIQTHRKYANMDRVCGNQLHFDQRGQPLWWNSGVVRDKFTVGSPYLKYTAYMKDEDGIWDFPSSCLVQKNPGAIMEVDWEQRKIAFDILRADRDVAVEYNNPEYKEILEIPRLLRTEGPKGGKGNSEAV